MDFAEAVHELFENGMKIRKPCWRTSERYLFKVDMRKCSWLGVDKQIQPFLALYDDGFIYPYTFSQSDMFDGEWVEY